MLTLKVVWINEIGKKMIFLLAPHIAALIWKNV